MRRRFALLALGLCMLLAPLPAHAVPTAFTYQGQLLSGGAPATGTYAFTFRLWDSASGGTQIGGDLTFAALAVTQGLFSVDLDFGPGMFDGSARWLEVIVTGPADAAPTTLAPRTSITSAPYAIYAGQAPGGSGAPSQWITNGRSITYPTGSIGVLGASSPFAAGKGVFLEGGNASYANVWAFNYDNYVPLNLLLNAPGGFVGINNAAPGHNLDVSGVGRVINYGTTFDNEGYSSAFWAVGHTGSNLMFGSRASNGVTAFSDDARAVYGLSTRNLGVVGECSASGAYAMLGTPTEGLYASTPNVAIPAGHFVCPTGGIALVAAGLAQVKTLQILGGADLAERFPVSGETDPGTVLALDESHPGSLRVSDEAYSPRVAGVVSGANGLSPGAVMSDREDVTGTAAVALSGRVWVKCDAGAGAIHIGDRLTTAARPGYAMRATDASRTDGALLGKAMSSLESGTGMVLVLVSLR